MRIFVMVLAAATGLAALAAPVADSILASVDGEAINLGDVLKETQLEEQNFGRMNLSPAELHRSVIELRSRALEELIDRKLILADYRKRPFPIPEQYIESALDDTARRMGCRGRGEFADAVRRNNWSLDEMRESIRERIILQVMVNNRQKLAGEVTPKQARDYFDAHQEEFTEPESYRLILLLTPKTPELAGLQKTLRENPAELDELAKSSPSAADGDLGWIAGNALREDFADLMQKEPSAGVWGPLPAGETDVIFFRAAERRPGVVKDFTEVREAITDRLTGVLRRKSRDEYLSDLRAESIVKYYR